MKSIIRKFKKLNVKYKVMFWIFGLLFLSSVVFMIQSLLLLKNIETVLRILIIIFLIISFVGYIFLSIIFLFSKKYKKYIINSVIISILSIGFIILSIYINKTYNIVDNMNKRMITYSTSLVVMKDTEFKNDKDFVVGMISDESNIEGNVLANKLIDKKKLDKIDIKYYDDNLEMLNDLYNGSIKGILISSNYALSYQGYENYVNIKTDTKVVYTYREKMKNQDIKLGSNKSLTEPFTILLLGVDSEVDGLDQNTVFNGDTMMLITFNPKTLNTTIFSIPRDTYVPISCNGKRSNKINSSAIGGATCVINTIQDLIGIDIDYYVKINFKGVVDLVEALKGIEVDVPVDFCEQDSNRMYENEICLSKGLQTLNGEQALALSRHRHSLPLGDFQRVQHQQLVVEAMAKKVKTIRSVNMFYDVLNAVSKNIETNVSTDEMLNLYDVGKKMMFENGASLNIEKTYLTGYDLTMLIPGLGNVYTFQYYPESLNEIIKAMKVNLGLEEPELVKTFNFSVNYEFEVPVIGKQYYSVKRNEALPNFVGNNINYLNTWASSRNISVNVNYITEGMSGYDESKNGIIVSQNIEKGTLVSSISSITVGVVKVNEVTTPTIKDDVSEESNGSVDDNKSDVEENKDNQEDKTLENEDEKNTTDNDDNDGKAEEDKNSDGDNVVENEE